MPIFKELDPEVAFKAIEGFDNVLEPATRVADAFYRQFRCPRCGGRCNKHFISPQHAFADPDSLVPRYALKCSTCNCVFDPHANSLIVEMGSAAAKVERDRAAGIPWVGEERDDD